MDVSFQNSSNLQINNPEFQKRAESQENFTALDKQKISQDMLELSEKAPKDMQESWLFRIMRNTFGIKEPKKVLKAIGLTIGTVIGLGFIGNKLSLPTDKLGNTIDDFLLKGDNILSKGYRAISGALTNLKSNIATKLENSKSNTIKDIYTTLSTKKAQPIHPLARSYGSSGTGIFGLTSPDTLKSAKIIPIKQTIKL